MNYKVNNLIRKSLKDDSLLQMQHTISYHVLAQDDTNLVEFYAKKDMKLEFSKEILEKMLAKMAVTTLDTPNGREYRLALVCIPYEQLVTLCNDCYNEGLNHL